MFKSYFSDLSRLVFRPILFYTRMPEGEWSDKPVTFTGITALLISAFLTFSIFVTQYFQIGATLLSKVAPAKYIIISPVMLVLAFMFFVITFTLAFGIILALLLALFWVLGALTFAGANMFGKRGDYIKDVKASLYASGIMNVFAIPALLIILTKHGIIDFTTFTIGYNMIYSFAVLYYYGLFAIMIRKTHGLEKSKAFIAALVPTLFLVLAGVLASKIILPRISPWIT